MYDFLDHLDKSGKFKLVDRWMRVATKDPFKVLGLPDSASDAEVKSAYRKLALKNHPDSGGEHNRFLEIKDAYDLIMEPGFREEYERQKQLHSKNNRGKEARLSVALNRYLFETDEFNQLFNPIVRHLIKLYKKNNDVWNSIAPYFSKIESNLVNCVNSLNSPVNVLDIARYIFLELRKCIISGMSSEETKNIIFSKLYELI